MIKALSGQNSFMLQRYLHDAIDDFVVEHGDFGLERLDGDEADFGRMCAALESVPFLSAKKCVVLDRPGNNDRFLESAEQVFQNIADGVEVIIVEPQLDARTVYAKYLKKHTEFHSFSELDDVSLEKWLRSYANEKGATLDSATARYLVQRVGITQQALKNELDKLIAYDPKISKESINLLTEPTPQSSIFALIDAVFSGNVTRAFAVYDDQRAQKVEPQPILAMLARHVHMLALVKSAPSDLGPGLAKDIGQHPYAVSQVRVVARKISMRDIQTTVAKLRSIDRDDKTSSTDLDDAIKQFIISLSAK